jgi:transketolase N-terminal domain/subunit
VQQKIGELTQTLAAQARVAKALDQAIDEIEGVEEALRTQGVREMHDLALRVIAVGYKVLAKEGRDRERLKRVYKHLKQSAGLACLGKD